MIQAKHKYQAYTAATQTVAKTKQIVLLYDGVIRFVQQSKDAIAAKRIEDRYNLLTKATTIISGLQACLDFEKGGDIAKVLFNFYSSINNRIFSIHRTNSLTACDEVISDLKKMRDVWHEIDQGTAGNDANTAAPADSAAPPAPVAPAAPAASATKNPERNVTLSV